MKNYNILIIILVTVFALAVIATVILASVLNGSEETSDSDPSESESRSYSQIESSYVFSESSVESSESSDVPDDPVAINIVNTAKSILEREPKIPFVENGASLDGFDNSGFIFYVLRENGFMTCPRGLNEQSKMAARLEFDELKRGDLVFFCNEGSPNEAGYGGIYVGDGKMIACLMPGTFVQEVDISGSYYEENFYCGVSLS